MTLEQAFTEAGSVGTPRFERFMHFVIPAECEFVAGHQDDYAFVRLEDVPGDDGGWTMYGIDASSHPGVRIKDLDLRGALQLYYAKDWVPAGIEDFPAGYAEFLMDVHLNGGNGPRMVQNGLNDCGASLIVDGDIGPRSLAAMAQYGSAGVLAAIKRRDAYFQWLADNYPHDRQFLNGWDNRDDALRDWLARNMALTSHLSLN